MAEIPHMAYKAIQAFGDYAGSCAKMLSLAARFNRSWNIAFHMLVPHQALPIAAPQMTMGPSSGESVPVLQTSPRTGTGVPIGRPSFTV